MKAAAKLIKNDVKLVKLLTEQYPILSRHRYISIKKVTDEISAAD